jgi:hypothetical protein
MDTGGFGIPISMRQINFGLFNHSVHLSSFWCEIEERATVGIDPPLASVMVRFEITESPMFGLWCPGFLSAPPNPPIYRSLPRLYPDICPGIGGAS